MPRTTTDPRTKRLLMRLTVSEEESLRKCAEALQTTKTEVVLRALRQFQAALETEKAGNSRKQPA